MSFTPPPLPPGRPARFRSTVHGTVFNGRDRHVDGVREGDALLLVPDPPVEDAHEVWVHLPTGEPVGHLPPEIAGWLWRWMYAGGLARARVLRVRGGDAPSWKRLLLEIRCGAEAAGPA